MSQVFEDMNNIFRNSQCDFAEAVTFKLNSTSTAKIIYVNFFNDASESPFGESQITRKEPICLANTDDVAGTILHATTITRGGITYYVAKSDPDDNGETVLYLTKNQIT